MTSMDAAFVGLRVALALVFTAAAAGKLLDRSGSRRALADFGAPSRLVAPAAIILPAVELAIAVMLAISRFAHWGATAAFVLLLLFLGGVTNSLRQGLQHNCHCFGQLHSAPVNWWTAARNAAIAAAAAVVAVVAWGDRGGSGNGGSGEADLLILAAVAAVLLLTTLVQVVQRPPERLRDLASTHPRLQGVGRVARRYTSSLDMRNTARVPRGLPSGAVAPGFSLARTDHTRVTLASLLAAGKPVVLYFSDPGCVPCVALLPAIARWQHTFESRLTIVVVTAGSVEANRAKNDAHALQNVLIQKGREVAEAYRIRSTPSAILVALDGRIASVLAIGEEAVTALVESVNRELRSS
jgi:peroxiredoxin